MADEFVIVEYHLGEVDADFFEVGENFGFEKVLEVAPEENVRGYLEGRRADKVELNCLQDFTLLFFYALHRELFVRDFLVHY